jgi:hypothetical protein
MLRCRSPFRRVMFMVVASIFLGPLAASAQAPPPPSQVGQWAGPWEWSVLTAPGQAFAHAILISAGPYTGKILMWPEDFNATSTTFYLLDPASPQGPNHIGSILSNVFCSSHTARKDGTIILCGGFPGPNPQPSQPCANASVPDVDLTASFNPPAWAPPQKPMACWDCSEARQSWLFNSIATQPQFSALPTMNQSRYYPSQVAVPGGILANLAAGDPIVIGGTQDFQCGINDLDPNYWPTSSNVYRRNIDKRYVKGWEYPQAITGNPPGAFFQAGGTNPQPGDFWPGWGTTAAVAFPYFRFFPQTFLLASPGTGQPTTANVFIAGDTHFDWLFGAAPTTFPTPNPLSWNVYQVPNVLTASYKLDVAASTLTQVASSVPDRFYSSAVVMHTSSSGPIHNRVLRFGGSSGLRNNST